MGGWEDGRMGGWEDGRMGGWEEGRPDPGDSDVKKGLRPLLLSLNSSSPRAPLRPPGYWHHTGTQRPRPVLQPLRYKPHQRL
ncbi:hypothetical protein EYF80_065523 [Liparis tanakae]|uniref:Uncharacterized protein n=1 Tax=Liparis tanakae TaxID=230148 RepID=A0A4Z2E6T2_9TELE|nr:hypothetical protein EYF80_065523 [Liparis tanakae]